MGLNRGEFFSVIDFLIKGIIAACFVRSTPSHTSALDESPKRRSTGKSVELIHCS